MESLSELPPSKESQQKGDMDRPLRETQGPPYKEEKREQEDDEPQFNSRQKQWLTEMIRETVREGLRAVENTPSGNTSTMPVTKSQPSVGAYYSDYHANPAPSTSPQYQAGSGYSSFWAEEVGYFDPLLDQLYGPGDVVTVGRDTGYWNVHLFCDWLKDMP